MNRKIETYIRLAMDELKAEGSLNKEFKGYIASLGPAINMSGLVPALAFYSAKENSAKADRSKVLTWIFNILKKDGWAEAKKFDTLFKLSLDGATDKRKLQKDIEDASVALKLSIRTFSLTE